MMAQGKFRCRSPAAPAPTARTTRTLAKPTSPAGRQTQHHRCPGAGRPDGEPGLHGQKLRQPDGRHAGSTLRRACCQFRAVAVLRPGLGYYRQHLKYSVTPPKVIHDSTVLFQRTRAEWAAVVVSSTHLPFFKGINGAKADGFTVMRDSVTDLSTERRGFQHQAGAEPRRSRISTEFSTA